MGWADRGRQRPWGPALFDRLLKLAFIASCLGFVFAYGVVVGKYQYFPYRQLDYLRDNAVLLLQEWDVLTGSQPSHFLQPKRFPGRGVTVNRAGGDRSELILLAGFFEDAHEIRLMYRDGTLVRRWPADFFEYFPDPAHMARPPATDWNVETHGALVGPDGSVVFNFEYGGTVKLDRCGKLEWALAHPTHHSVEPAADGGYWIPGRRFFRETDRSPYPPFEVPFNDDLILRVAADGSIVREFSVAELLYRNGLEAVLTANRLDLRAPSGQFRDLVHLNKIAELPATLAADFPAFAAGDLLLSLRDLNLLLVIDPAGLTVKWWQIGPWLRQHDPEFRAGGNLVVLSNNFPPLPGVGPAWDDGPLGTRGTSVIAFDSLTGNSSTLYGSRPGEDLQSRFKGKIDLRPEGGLLITEFAGGRAFEVDAAGQTLWQYMNAWGEDQVAELNEARVYPAAYFEVTDWSCE